MATCKECLHYKACLHLIDVEHEVLKVCENFVVKSEVKVEKLGSWKKSGNKKECSECGFFYYSGSPDYKFCPECGATMRGHGCCREKEET